jgi:5'-deoxynucleotidase YfbR-like HD superfamily hydrolase
MQVSRGHLKTLKTRRQDSFSPCFRKRCARITRRYFSRRRGKHIYAGFKAADKLSALIKCIEEEKTGNTDFRSAKETITVALHDMQLVEVEDFMRDFLPAYGKTLDELGVV